MEEPKILIIDKDPEEARMAARVLGRRGFRCLIAPSAFEGLKRFYDWRPDLCIVDLAIPRMNGANICRKMKSSKIRRRVPVILTYRAVETPTWLINALSRTGADGFLPKPLCVTELAAVVEAAFRESPARRHGSPEIASLLAEPAVG